MSYKKHAYNTNSNYKQCHVAYLYYFMNKFSQELIRRGLDPANWWWTTEDPFDSVAANFALNEGLSWNDYRRIHSDIEKEFTINYPLLKMFVTPSGLFSAYRTANWPLKTRKKYFTATKVLSVPQVKKAFAATLSTASRKAVVHDFTGDLAKKNIPFDRIISKGLLLTSVVPTPDAELEFDQLLIALKESQIPIKLTGSTVRADIVIPAINLNLSSARAENLSSELGKVILKHIEVVSKQVDKAIKEFYKNNLVFELDGLPVPPEITAQMFSKFGLNNTSAGTSLLLRLLRKHKRMKTSKMSVEQALTSSDQMFQMLGKIKGLNETSG